jgi:uncharacterized protein (TIGR03435 family)
MLKYLPAIVAALLCSEIEAQTRTEFEVASIKPSSSGQMGCIGGPGSRDPNRVRCPNADLFFLIRYAYHLWNWEFKEMPWMHDQAFEVLVNIPPNTTKDDFLLMFQSLLEQRFHLTYHREDRRVQGYRLLIAKGGAKLATSSEGRKADEPLPSVPRDFPLAVPRGVSSLGYRRTMHYNDLTMSDFSDRIAGYLGGPVLNETGLDGKYDILLYWVADSGQRPDEESGPMLVASVLSQLGLKLEPNKADVKVFVVDHADKMPTEN